VPASPGHLPPTGGRPRAAVPRGGGGDGGAGPAADGAGGGAEVGDDGHEAVVELVRRVLAADEYKFLHYIILYYIFAVFHMR
jgi:hypothetical protein